MPETLSGADIEFKFESPLHEAAERRKGQKFLEATEALGVAAELDPGSRHLLDAREALRDVLGGIGTPSDWLRDEEKVEELAQAEAQAQQADLALAQAGEAAAAAKDAGAAVQSFAGAQPAGPGPV